MWSQAQGFSMVAIANRNARQQICTRWASGSPAIPSAVKASKPSSLARMSTLWIKAWRGMEVATVYHR